MPPNIISIEKVDDLFYYYDLLDSVDVDKQSNDCQIISEVVGQMRESKSR